MSDGQYIFVNPDDLPEGDPLKDLIRETQRVRNEMNDTRDGFRFDYNDRIYPISNLLRDVTNSENDFHKCIQVFKNIEERLFAELNAVPKEGKAQTLRMLSEACLHAADCCDEMDEKIKKTAQEMSDNLDEGDYDHG